MVYLAFGEEDFIIEKEIIALAQKNGFDSSEIVKFNLQETSMENVVSRSSIVGLFNSQNFVVAYDLEKWIEKKYSNEKQAHKNYLLNQVNQNQSSFLVLVNHGKEVQDQDILSTIKKHNNLIECQKLKTLEIKKIIKQAFVNREVIVSKPIIDYLFQKLGNNIRLLVNEIEKLSLLEKKIDNSLIDQFIKPKTEGNIFSLIEAIINKNLPIAMQKYEEMVKVGTSPLNILTLVSSEIALMLIIKLAKKEFMSNQEIANKFKKPLFVVSKAYKNIKKYSKEKLIKLNHDLANLEFAYKSGQLNSEIIVELFLIKLIKEK